jgi:hypothetical protein
MSAHFFSQFRDSSGTLSEAISQAELRRNVYNLCAPKSHDELPQQSCNFGFHGHAHSISSVRVSRVPRGHGVCE